MEYLNFLNLGNISFDTKRFRMRKTLLKPSYERSESEIQDVADVLQVISIPDKSISFKIRRQR